VIGDKSDVMEVKKTESERLPLLIYVSKPEICPPGTISIKIDAVANTDSLKINAMRKPTEGRAIS
jgi:hypothetical protein